MGNPRKIKDGVVNAGVQVRSSVGELSFKESAGLCFARRLAKLAAWHPHWRSGTT